jgi:Flp pilus assembly protein TadG
MQGETMERKSVRNRLKDTTGQNLVEFALVVPMLLLLVFGIAEFGRAWMTKNIMTGAAREAVRIAVVPSGTIGAATARANQVLGTAGITSAIVSVSDDGISFGTMTATVTYNFPVIIVGFIPGLNSSTIPLTSTTTMRKEF